MPWVTTLFMRIWFSQIINKRSLTFLINFFFFKTAEAKKSISKLFPGIVPSQSLHQQKQRRSTFVACLGLNSKLTEWVIDVKAPGIFGNEGDSFHLLNMQLRNSIRDILNGAFRKRASQAWFLCSVFLRTRKTETVRKLKIYSQKLFTQTSTHRWIFIIFV